MKTFHILTIFPEIFRNNSYFDYSILKRAQEKNLIQIKAHNLRDFANDKHNKVDDIPYGGGPGMVFKIEPIYTAVKSIENREKRVGRTRIILFSTRGKKFDDKTAQRLALCDSLILICGRYEGVDERVAKYIADEEISMGDYVFSGGELPAMVLIEAVSRFVPGVLGKTESLETIKGSYPVYTRPEIFKVPSFTPPAKRGGASAGKQNSRFPSSVASGDLRRASKNKEWKVPVVLLSGNHKKIDEWRARRH